MKKIMWSISGICLAGTALALQVLPMKVPMHYNAAGVVDRWGSKYECMIMPVIVLLNSLLWHCVILYFEKKALRTEDEMEAAHARSNAKSIGIIGIVTAIMHTVIQGALLYASYIGANANTKTQMIDIQKIFIIAAGFVCIICGNILPKTRPNYIVGFRVRWSRYNNVTWKKTNQFGAIWMMMAGIVIIGATMIFDSEKSMLVSAGAIGIASLVTLIYSYRIYLQERAADEPHREL